MDDDTHANTGPAPRRVTRLRLVSSRPQAVALRSGSYDVQFTPNEPRRPDGRRKKGTAMTLIDRIIHTAGRFAFGFGTALALVCAFVIVAIDPRLDGSTAAAPAEVVRLDPVVVTISADRYDELQAALREPSAVVRVADHRAEAG